MKKIELTQGFSATVDDRDFEELSKFKWFAYKSRYTFYAARRVRVAKGKQKSLTMHQVIMGNTHAKRVDHIDGDGLNNVRKNLRLATNAENGRNRRKHKNNSSGFKGVYFHKPKQKFQAQIRVNYRLKSLGYYNTAEEAHAAYCAGAVKYHHEFARFK